MKAIYMNWRPCRPDTPYKDEFNDVNLLTMAAGALKSRSFGMQTKLYGDLYTYKFLEKTGLLGCWDQVDGTSLDEKIDRSRYDVSYFFNIGKFFALSLETAPVIMPDIDLILWQDISQLLAGCESVFTHWEAARPATPWYCGRQGLHTPPGYEWNRAWDFRLRAANTSILYFKDSVVKDDYCGQAIRFMDHNFIEPQGPVRPEIYFIEQRLFLMCLKARGLIDRTVPVIDTLWDPAKGRFTKKDKTLGWWDYYIPEPEQRVTHTWISKKAIEENRSYRDYYCCRLLDEVLNMAPCMEAVLRKNKLFHRYFLLLDEHGSIRHLLNSGAASDKLY